MLTANPNSGSSQKENSLPTVNVSDHSMNGQMFDVHLGQAAPRITV